MAKTYLPYDLEQRMLLPQDMREWLVEGHLALFVADVIAELDLSAIHRVHAGKDDRGRAAYHPAMMLGLLVYGYCTGVRSSRRIERATYEDVPVRVLAGGQHPDHDSIAAFRKTHAKAFHELFLQVLQLCQKAGLVKLGHIAIDGTKIKANASKHKAMSYERMEAAEQRLEEEVKELIEDAERTDAEEDAKHGKGKRGDDLPEELKRRETRIKKIREAKASLEQEAKERAAAQAAETQAKRAEREREAAEKGKKATGAKPPIPNPEQAVPEPKAQRNFTDPESRVMPDGANKGAFLQGYNAQVAVDGASQIIVAAHVTQNANDVRELLPMLKAIVENVGALATTTSADAGYFSVQNVTDPALAGTTLLVPPRRPKHVSTPQTGSNDADASAADQMRFKLATPEGKALYKMRKAIVEPVFGQMKGPRQLRQFLLRGLEAVGAEYAFMALTHNLLKLFRSGARVARPSTA